MTMHHFPIRVFYEDTDMAGIVYYANYLKFIERGRSTLVREAGVDQLALKADGIVFVVRHVAADFLASAVLDDQLDITTELQQLSGVRLVFDQQVKRGSQTLFSAEVTVVCMNAKGKPVRLPTHISEKLLKFSAEK